MYELIKITDCNYYMDCPTRVGIYESAPGEVWLIDSGSDKDAARKLWGHIGAQGWTVKGILLTHSHADHMGGAGLIMQRSGCRAYANARERCLAGHTTLGPALLYGGYPPNALRGKFLVAQSVPCEDIGDAALPEGVEIIELPGHCHEMFGVKTPQGVFFCADAVCSRETTEKYHINFVYDVRAALDCLEGLRLKTVDAKWYLPAHAELTQDITALARLNREKMLEIIGLIRSICAEPRCFEDILATVFDHYGLEMSLAQYILAGSSIRSYLAYMLDNGDVRVEPVKSHMLWSVVR